jgi:diphosphomevalonate decarboxylase
MEITTSCAPNIAVIKYWGKRSDNELNLPMNGSVSVTLSQEQLNTTTSVFTCPTLKVDRFWLNGKENAIGERMKTVICAIKDLKRNSTGIKYETKSSLECASPDWNLHICSVNNFPTGAGLASSASGLSCLVYTLILLYHLDSHYTMEELSQYARMGSGSACRSLFGGFVEWTVGIKANGADSIARQIKPFVDMTVFIVITDKSEKKISSTIGMQQTVKTSELYTHRQLTVQTRINEMKEYIQKEDWGNVFKLTMRDSNQFHAVCLDTYPPIMYLNDISREIIQTVSDYNEIHGISVAYTFDAGPNAVLFIKDNPEQFKNFLNERIKAIEIIETTIGHGPLVLETSLFDKQGFPKKF